MGRQAVLTAYAGGMVVVIVAVDLLFFRHHFGQRLIANMFLVLTFGAVYVTFLRRR